MNKKFFVIVACVSSLVVRLLTDSSAVIPLVEANQPKQEINTPKLLPPQADPCKIAQAITVKVIFGNSWGSGILIQKQGKLYSVLTNQHLLIGNNYDIETPDKKRYPATVLRFKAKEIVSDDLAILQFESDSLYGVAKLAENLNLSVGQPVLAAGFPVNANSSQNRGFVCQWPGGKISLVLNKPMQEGYQIGYFIDIAKGMSGGPLLTPTGDVIGVNGKHSDPLIFNNPDLYLYKDGSRVNESLELLTKSSWAIPIKTFLEQAPHSLELTKPTVATQSSPSPSVSPIPKSHSSPHIQDQ